MAIGKYLRNWDKTYFLHRNWFIILPSLFYHSSKNIILSIIKNLGHCGWKQMFCVISNSYLWSSPKGFIRLVTEQFVTPWRFATPDNWSCKTSRLLKQLTTLQSIMNTKLSMQSFWHCYENRLIKTIKTIPHNLYVSLKLTSLYCGLRLILVYPNP